MTLFDSAHMMSRIDLVAIGVEIVRIDSGCILEKDVTKLIYINS